MVATKGRVGETKGEIGKMLAAERYPKSECMGALVKLYCISDEDLRSNGVDSS